MQTCVQVPVSFISETMPSLHGAEVKLLLFLFLLGALVQPAQVSIETLALKTGLSPRGVNDALSALEGEGHVMCVRNGGGQANMYKIRASVPAVAATFVEPPSVYSELTELLAYVIPALQPEVLHDLVRDREDEEHLLVCLRQLKAKGHSFADSNLFHSAILFWGRQRGWWQ